MKKLIFVFFLFATTSVYVVGQTTSTFLTANNLEDLYSFEIKCTEMINLADSISLYSKIAFCLSEDSSFALHTLSYALMCKIMIEKLEISYSELNYLRDRNLNNQALLSKFDEMYKLCEAYIEQTLAKVATE